MKFILKQVSILKVSCLIPITFALLFSSCKEEPVYELSLSIKSDIGSSMTVELFPLADYQSYDLYRFSDFESGYNKMVFDVVPGQENHLFSTRQIDIKPDALARKVFESIYVTISDQNKTKLMFTPEQVTGYMENLYGSDTSWTYERREESRPTMFQTNPVILHSFTFYISEDKILR